MTLIESLQQKVEEEKVESSEGTSGGTDGADEEDISEEVDCAVNEEDSLEGDKADEVKKPTTKPKQSAKRKRAAGAADEVEKTVAGKRAAKAQ